MIDDELILSEYLLIYNNGNSITQSISITNLNPDSNFLTLTVPYDNFSKDNNDLKLIPS